MIVVIMGGAYRLPLWALQRSTLLSEEGIKTRNTLFTYSFKFELISSTWKRIIMLQHPYPPSLHQHTILSQYLRAKDNPSMLSEFQLPEVLWVYVSTSYLPDLYPRWRQDIPYHNCRSVLIFNCWVEVSSHFSLKQLIPPQTTDWSSGSGRSEERRVGKECSSRWSPDH